MSDTTKKSTRGISRDTVSQKMKLFKPKKEINKGLNLVTVTEVNVTAKVANEKSKQIDFRGLEVPSLNIVFTQADAPTGVEPAKYIHNFRAVEENNPKRESYESGMMQMMYHLATSIIGRDLTDAEFNTLSLDIEEGATPEQVLAAYGKLFNAVKAIITIDTKDKFWLKLLLYNNGVKVNKGNFGLPMFVPSSGIIERYVKGIEPSLEIEIAKGESITPKEEDAQLPTQNGAAPIKQADVPSYMK